jgi:hypothetical protein
MQQKRYSNTLKTHGLFFSIFTETSLVVCCVLTGRNVLYLILTEQKKTNVLRISTSIDVNDPAFWILFSDCELSFQIASSYRPQGVRPALQLSSCPVASNYSVQISSKLLAAAPSSAMQTRPVRLFTGHRFISENSQVLSRIVKYFQTLDFLLRQWEKLSNR